MTFAGPLRRNIRHAPRRRQYAAVSFSGPALFHFRHPSALARRPSRTARVPFPFLTCEVKCGAGGAGRRVPTQRPGRRNHIPHQDCKSTSLSPPISDRWNTCQNSHLRLTVNEWISNGRFCARLRRAEDLNFCGMRCLKSLDMRISLDSCRTNKLMVERFARHILYRHSAGNKTSDNTSLLDNI